VGEWDSVFVRAGRMGTNLQRFAHNEVWEKYSAKTVRRWGFKLPEKKCAAFEGHARGAAGACLPRGRMSPKCQVDAGVDHDPKDHRVMNVGVSYPGIMSDGILEKLFSLH
jgi:hypothetical protein